MERWKDNVKTQKLQLRFVGIIVLLSIISAFPVTGGTGAVSALIGMRLFQLRKNRRYVQSGIHKVDGMNTLQFEQYVASLFRSLGYTVRLANVSGNLGRDIILKRNGTQTLVHARKCNEPVEQAAICEVTAALSYYRAKKAWIISNSTFTRAATRLARDQNVQLINREGLIKLSLQQLKIK